MGGKKMHINFVKFTQQFVNGGLIYAPFGSTHRLNMLSFEAGEVVEVIAKDAETYIVGTNPSSLAVPVGPSQIHLVDTKTGKIKKSVDVSERLSAICWDGGYVWAVSPVKKTLHKINIETEEEEVISINISAVHVCYNGTHIIVGDMWTGSCAMINPTTCKVFKRMVYKSSAPTLTCAATNKYLFVGESNSIKVRSLENASVVHELHAVGKVSQLIYDGEHLWGLNGTTIVQIDPETFSIVDTILIEDTIPSTIAGTRRMHVSNGKVIGLWHLYGGRNCIKLLATHNGEYTFYNCLHTSLISYNIQPKMYLQPEMKKITIYYPTTSHDTDYLRLSYYDSYRPEPHELVPWLFSNE